MHIWMARESSQDSLQLGVSSAHCAVCMHSRGRGTVQECRQERAGVYCNDSCQDKIEFIGPMDVLLGGCKCCSFEASRGNASAGS